MKSASCTCLIRDAGLIKRCCYNRWEALVKVLSRIGIRDAHRQYFGTSSLIGPSVPEGYTRVHLPGGKYSPNSHYRKDTFR